jgi:DNA-binding MarR family transcriptional regulator
MARRDLAADPRDGTDLVAAWRDLATCYSSVRCALDRELDEQHGLGMSEFEALDRLAGAPHGKQRMQELGEAMYLSQSALSRVVARLEREGLVLRDVCLEDRRGVYVRLTETGEARHAAARPTQLAVLARHLGSELEGQPATSAP